MSINEEEVCVGGGEGGEGGDGGRSQRIGRSQLGGVNEWLYE